MSELAPFQHPRFARMYQEMSAESDRRGGAAHRRELLAGITGLVLEIGAGHGANFPHYPATVQAVTAVEPEEQLRTAAGRAARAAPVSVQVVAGHADEIPAADASVDVVVASLVLCSVPDQGRALSEISRVLKPGGELRYYEHVRSSSPAHAVLEEVVTPLWRLGAGGCHPNRRTSSAIADAGFRIERERRFAFRPLRLTLRLEHVIGLAVRSDQR